MRKFKLTIQVDGVDWDVAFLDAENHRAAWEELVSTTSQKHVVRDAELEGPRGRTRNDNRLNGCEDLLNRFANRDALSFLSQPMLVDL